MKHIITALIIATAFSACAQPPEQDSARLITFWHPPTLEGAYPDPQEFKGYSVHTTRVYSKFGFATTGRLARFQVDKFAESIPEAGWFIIDIEIDGETWGRYYYHKVEPDHAKAIHKSYFRP